MTTELAVFKKDDAQTILSVVRYLVANGYAVKPGQSQPQLVPHEAPVYVRNDSGEEIPAFACMQTTGAIDAGGQNYIKVTKPVDDTGTTGRYLFNGIAPIEIGGYGIGHDGPLVRMLTNAATITCGDSWQPTVGAWSVKPGGSLFTAAGPDDIGTNVMRGFVGRGGLQARVYRTPGGGIAARSGATLGSATCTRVTVTGGTRTVTADVDTVYNDFLSAVSPSVDVITIMVDGIWIVQAEDCS